MPTIETNKYVINLNNVVAGVVNDSGVFILYFVDGSSLTLNNSQFNEVYGANPDFMQFTEKVIINKKHILYVKNNFESAKANKYKVTVVLPKQEFFIAYPATEEGEIQAKKLFISYLSSL